MTMAQAYSDPSRENLPYALPDIEVFYDKACGWYWWPCFPGCLPDGGPTGPFDTEAEALADAREDLDP